MSHNASKKQRRDWFQIIRVDLAYAGISQAKVARACNRDPKTVENWTLDNEPKDSDARVILALYKKFCLDKYITHMKEFQPDLVLEYDLPPPAPKKPRTYQPDPQTDMFKMVKP